MKKGECQHVSQLLGDEEGMKNGRMLACFLSPNIDLIEDDIGHANWEKTGLFLNFKITVILIERIDEAGMARPHHTIRN